MRFFWIYGLEAVGGRRFMLENGLEFESKAVKLYNEALLLSVGDRALEVFLEDILQEEQHGVDEMTKLLRSAEPADSGKSQTKAG